MSDTSSLRATLRIDLLLNERIEEPHRAAFLRGAAGISGPKRGIEKIGIGHNRGLSLPDSAAREDPALTRVTARVGAPGCADWLEHADSPGGKAMIAKAERNQIGAVISVGDQLETPVVEQR